MMSAIEANRIRVYGTDQQAMGAFDGGRITETKPIGFPGEGSVVDRIGPLFYWAWASAKEEGAIALHPHRGFEIASYVVSGKLGHYDTLGNQRAVGPGGIQVMQTGSGVSHEEAMLEPNTQFLQIWFEPNLNEAVTRPATYADYEASDLAPNAVDGIEFTPLLGDGAPMHLVADATVRMVRISPNRRYERTVGDGRSIALLVLDGEGILTDERRVGVRDFLVLDGEQESTFAIATAPNQYLELVEIEVPTHVDYPLYKQPKG